MIEKNTTKAEIEIAKQQEKANHENDKKKGLVELNDNELESVTGGYWTWKDKHSVEFMFNVGDEVEVYDEPILFRWTTERVKITCQVLMNYTDDNTWVPAYEGYEVDGGKFREFCEWECEGAHY